MKIKNKFKNLSQQVACLLMAAFALTVHNSHAEGTKEVSPNNNNLSALAVVPGSNSGSYLNAPEENRIHFRIENTNEKLYFGFNWRGYENNPSYIGQNKVYARVYNESGVQQGGIINLTAASSPTNSTAGYISDYNRAINGPNIGGVSNGYNPLIFTPTSPGNYYISIYKSADNGVTALVGSGISEGLLSPYFDFTVASTQGSTINKKTGRVFSKKWGLVAVNTSFSPHAQASAMPSFYSYSFDSTITKISFNNDFMPILYDVAITRYGVAANGDFELDRQSRNASFLGGQPQSPQLNEGYLLFLTMPDPAAYPTPSILEEPTMANPPIIGCEPPFLLRFYMPAAGDAKILLNFNGIPGYQHGTSDRILEAFDINAGLNTIVWDGKNGLGQLVDAHTTIKLSATYLRGRFNIPIYDAEINKYGFSVASVAPVVNNNVRLFWDDSNLTNVTGQSTQSNNNTGAGLNNSIVGTLSPAHAWSGNGNLSQIIPAPDVSSNSTNGNQYDDYGNVRTINTWGWALSNESDEVEIDFSCYAIYGNVLNDLNALKDSTVNGIGTNINNTLYAVLVDGDGKIFDTTSVNEDGTYKFEKLLPSTYKVIITKETPIIGNSEPIVSLPEGWVPSGENIGVTAGHDGLVDGKIVVTIVNDNIYNANFGIHNNSTNAVNDENSTWMNTPVSGDVTTNDFDLEGDTQTFGSFLNQDGTGTPIVSGSVVSGIDASGNPVADAGTIIFNIDGTYTFIPSNGFIGNVEIPYNTCDDGLPTVCDTAVLSITVSPFTSKGNSVIANNDEYYSYGDPVNANVFVNDADPQDDNFIVTEVKQGIVIINIGTPTQVSGVDEKGNHVSNAGTLTQNADGTMTFVPESGFAGTVTYNYTITDDNSAPASDNADVVITVLRDKNGPKNDPPFAGDDFSITKVNTPVTGNFIGNDNDPNNDPLSYKGVTIDPSGSKTPIDTVTTEKGGTVILYADGTYEYTPPTDYIGPDAVVYEVCDVTTIEPQPLCADATIHLLVGGYGIAGNLFNDVNGMKDGLVNGNGTNVMNQMYAVLTNELGEVIESVAIAADGSYSFDNLLNNVDYHVWIDTTNRATGYMMTNSNVPNGWVSTGENVGVSPGNDGNTNGILQVGLLTNDVKDVNFAIEELPETVVNKVEDNGHYIPGEGIDIPADAFTEAYLPADPSTEDYSGGTVDSIRFTTFPYATDNGGNVQIDSIEINGQIYTQATWPNDGVIVSYDANLGISDVKVYPKNGQHEIVIPIASIDNAGFEDPTPGKVTLNLENALPIHILNFTAKGDNCEVVLNWNVRFDENGSVLNIEESKDGRQFEKIFKESLNMNHANSSMKHAATEGLSYYRLNIVTASGQSIYSAVKSVSIDCKKAMISLYPNPVQNELSLTGLTEGQTIVMHNSLGQIVNKVEVTSETMKLNTQTLANGSYYITIQDDNNTIIKSLKFVKQ